MVRMGPTVWPQLVLIIAVVGLQAVTSVIEINAQKFEPMVAFVCNKPAMHKVVNGWKRDDDVNNSCIQDSEKILAYCKKLYPTHDIKNVVESSHKVTIPNWCGFGVEHCHKHGNHTVRPFRCLVGPFQSEALLVPDHCIFDHYHDQRISEDFQAWNKTAMKKCASRSMVTQSFAMLWPCKTPGHFSGVEFVCCPKEDSAKHLAVPPQPPSVPETTQESLDDYSAYLKGDNKYLDRYNNEHQRFKLAEKAMQKRQHERDSQMMKEWRRARDRVREMKKSDPKQAMELNNELTERYKKIYQAYEEEGIAEKKQLDALHQQQVQKQLNERKRIVMEKLLDALVRPPKIYKVKKFAQRYIRIEEKDRLHTINHFQHVRDTDPEEAKNIRSRVIEHLNRTEKRINSFLERLKQNKDVATEVLPEIEQYLAGYHSINTSSIYDVIEPVSGPNPEVKQQQQISLSQSDENDGANSQNNVMPTNGKPEEAVVINGFDPETMENEHSYEHHEQPYVAHQVKHEQIAQQSQIAIQDYSSSSASSVFGIAIGGVAVFVIIVVAVVMLRKRSQRQRVTHGFVEVDPAASPEERHVANMQMNGYENPTYKYFEMQSQ